MEYRRETSNLDYEVSLKVIVNEIDTTDSMKHRWDFVEVQEVRQNMGGRWLYFHLRKWK